MKIFSQFPVEHGTYALILHCSEPAQAQVGSLGMLHIVPGWFIYIGSAFGSGGLRGRLSHHLDGGRPAHWHVDLLKPVMKLHSTWLTTGPRRLEHAWAAACLRMDGLEVPWAHFGASDCHCRSHLFYSEVKPHPGKFEAAIKHVIEDHPLVTVIELALRPPG